MTGYAFAIGLRCIFSLTHVPQGKPTEVRSSNMTAAKGPLALGIIRNFRAMSLTAYFSGWRCRTDFPRAKGVGQDGT